MRVCTVVRDCLYLNWVLPAAAVPRPPEPLQLETHPWQGGAVAFASALLFRQEKLHWPRFPLLRLSYPQLNLRLYVLDPDGVPSVFFCAMMMPGWIVPSVRMVAEQPARSGHFDYPRPSRGGDGWRWSVRGRGELRVAARLGAPAPGPGPSLGSWERLARCLSRRPRGYFDSPSGLRRIEASYRPEAYWPLAAEVEDASLLAELQPLDGAEWPPLHSAWLCPEIPFTFVLGQAEEQELARAATVAADPAVCDGRAAA